MELAAGIALAHYDPFFQFFNKRGFVVALEAAAQSRPRRVLGFRIDAQLGQRRAGAPKGLPGTASPRAAPNSAKRGHNRGSRHACDDSR